MVEDVLKGERIGRFTFRVQPNVEPLDDRIHVLFLSEASEFPDLGIPSSSSHPRHRG